MPFTLGIVPARGGSKRIPRKNIRDFCDKPLIAWTLEAAKSSFINVTLVSTDDEEIAECARAYGGNVPFIRPPELATDTAPSVDVALHALNWFEDNFRTPDAIVLLQPTSPLRRTAHINAALDCFYDNKDDSLYSYSRKETGRGVPNGCIYITRRDVLKSRRIATSKAREWEMKEPMPDIDTEEDWKEAERLMRQRRPNV